MTRIGHKQEYIDDLRNELGVRQDEKRFPDKLIV